MAEPHRVAAPRAFVAELNELHALAGRPTLSELRKLSRPSSGAGLPRELAESTTNDILIGKRKRVPDWPWVSSFVTACTTAAQRTGLDIGVMGDLQTWHRRWRAASEDPPEAVSGRPPDVRSAPAPVTVPQPAVQEEAPVAAPPRERAYASASTPRRTDRPATRSVPPPHSEATQLLLQIYGRTGVRLLRRSDARNGRDCMRLAVIALLKGWPDEARRWLHCAGDAGHGDAITLLYDPHWKREAAELAYHYGCEYQRADPRQLSVAIFFYRLAGDHGHPEAAYRLALAHQRKEEDWAAAMWFGRAATNGHPTAATEFHDASEHLIQAPWDADGILPIEVSNATAPLESLWPRDDSPPAFT